MKLIFFKCNLDKDCTYRNTRLQCDNRCRSDGSYLCALFCSYTHFINFNLYKVMKLCWNQPHFSQAEGWSKPRTPHQSITRLYRHKKTESKSPIQCTCMFFLDYRRERRKTHKHTHIQQTTHRYDSVFETQVIYRVRDANKQTTVQLALLWNCVVLKTLPNR